MDKAFGKGSGIKRTMDRNAVEWEGTNRLENATQHTMFYINRFILKIHCSSQWYKVT